MYDVVIIGGGVIGCSVAREISKYNLKVVVLEKDSDVASGTSKANSGIVHAGYSEKFGTLKAKYNVEGQRLYDKLASDLEFPFERCGSLVVCFDETGVKGLEELLENGKKNGLTNLKIINKDEVKKLEPNINENVYAALSIPEGGIVSPYCFTTALAENAVVNGVEFKFETEVNNIIKDKSGNFIISTNNENVSEIEAKVIVNAAGVYADVINNMLSENKIKIIPRLGEYILLDTTEANLVNRTIFQLPNKLGKGILVSPTTSKNIIIGPTVLELDDKCNVSTTTEGLKYAYDTGSLSVKEIPRNKIIVSFAGLRAHSIAGDFIIEESKDVAGLINLAGIESPGLAAAPAIANKATELICNLLNPTLNDKFNPKRKQFPVFKKLTQEEKNKLIKEDPNYGEIICRCEMVTKGEIINALRSPLKIKDVDAIKRRTRLGMGRCQGGFCHMKILQIIAQECNIDIDEVTKFGKGTNFLIEKNKESL